MPKNYTNKLNFKHKKFPFLKGVSGSVSKSENDHFGKSDGIFFFLEKKVVLSVFWGWNSLEIIVMLQLFQHYFGITDKSRENPIFHRVFDV